MCTGIQAQCTSIIATCFGIRINKNKQELEFQMPYLMYLVHQKYLWDFLYPEFSSKAQNIPLYFEGFKLESSRVAVENVHQPNILCNLFMFAVSFYICLFRLSSFNLELISYRDILLLNSKVCILLCGLCSTECV